MQREVEDEAEDGIEDEERIMRWRLRKKKADRRVISNRCNRRNRHKRCNSRESPYNLTSPNSKNPLK